MMLAEVNAGVMAINGETLRRSQVQRPAPDPFAIPRHSGFNPLLKYFKATLIGQFQ
jgi:hypothetical protein